jgi:hypothetical protein
MFLQQLADQVFGSLRVTPALDREIENKALLIDRAPEPMRLPATVVTTSSKCHLLPRGRIGRRRTRLQIPGQVLGPHCRIVSYVRDIPRARPASLRSNAGSVE